jgi:hypothetical protein
LAAAFTEQLLICRSLDSPQFPQTTMARSLLFAAFLAATVLPLAHGTTITFSASPTARAVEDSSGALLTNASALILAGTFTNPSFSINTGLSLAANYANVVASGGWEQFGLDTVTSALNTGVTGGFILSGSSKIGGSISDNNTGSTKADFFNGKQLYLWVFNASSVGAATQMGIFRSPNASTPWTFPVNAEGIGDGQSFVTSSGGAPTIAAIGGFGSSSGTRLTLTNNFNVVPVPEPSTLAFGVLTVVVAASSRRRR